MKLRKGRQKGTSAACNAIHVNSVENLWYHYQMQFHKNMLRKTFKFE